MPATCPSCERDDCKVRETFSQATRTEPMRSLGFQGYCPDCDLAFITEDEGVLWLRAGAPDAGHAWMNEGLPKLEDWLAGGQVIELRRTPA